MQIILNEERFYINLPKRLYKELIEHDKLNERMDLDLAVLILHFIIKNQSLPQAWVPLSSVILRKYDYGKYKSSEQIELLLVGGFIEYLNHQNNIPGKENSCRRFKILSKYFEQENKDSNQSIHTYEIKQEPLLKKLVKQNSHRKIEASSSTPHLTKWLESDGFSVDTEAALYYLKKQYHENSLKYITRCNKIIHFNPSHSYSRDGDDDRLHSIFTQIATDLKQFVRYRGEQLFEVDIKNSQPMMFVILLKEFLQHIADLSKCKNRVTSGRLKNRIYNTLKKYINNTDIDYYNRNKYTINIKTISNSITIILLESSKSPNIIEIENFISLVKSGVIYEHIGEFQLNKELIWEEKGTFITQLFNKEKNIQENFNFKSLRECGKTILINALYSPRGKGSILVINKVKEMFPSIFGIIDAFKDPFYKDFSLFLQRMEAKFVLDYCSENIAKKFPLMPLIARHDSLTTTQEYENVLFLQFQEEVKSYFGEALILDKEVW